LARSALSVKSAPGILKSNPVYLPARHQINGALMGANGPAFLAYMGSHSYGVDMSMLLGTSVLSSVMGVTLTMAIGGWAW